MKSRVLNSDWSDYDLKKMGTGEVDYFNSTEEWERKYLYGKIKELFPHIHCNIIMTAINMGCMSFPTPRPRDQVVFYIMQRLSIFEFKY